MKNCNRVKKLLEPYLFGELSETDKMRVENHLTECPNCAREVVSLQKVLKVIRRKEDEKFPQQMWDNFLPDLHKKLVTVKTPSGKISLWSEIFNRFFIHPKPAVRLATIALTLVIGIMIGRFYLQEPNDKALDLSELMEYIYSIEPRIEEGLDDSSLDQSLTRTEILFLEIVNLNTESAVKSFDITSAKSEATFILNNVNLISSNLQNGKKVKLLNDLKSILLDLANVEDNGASENIKLLRSLIIDEGLLVEIKVLKLGRQLEENQTRSMGCEYISL